MADGYQPVDSPDQTTVFPYHELTPPTTADVYEAREQVSRHLPKTPLVRSDWLSEELDADIYLKREDTLPTGAFKIRGGIALGANVDEEFREHGLIAASTGNHGQSVAYAGQKFNVPATICVPEDVNQSKVSSMETYGADIKYYGEDYDEARTRAEEMAVERQYRYVHSANEPDLVAGVGTAGLEIVEELPDVDLVFSPIGGGTCASGFCLTIGDILGSDVIGVQSAQAPAAHRAWEEGHLKPHDRMETTAEGLATRVPFAMTMDILRDKLSDFVLVDDEATLDALRDMIVRSGIIMEGACATTIAAALAHPELVRGQTVVLPVTGRNLAADKLSWLLEGR
ncbi:threonine/serine dehydratase [Halovenus rubra]|uniref:Threonine/serine dehydratase n=2 Tax=Halovenus rubra TaxID=869890 RepID=A0ACC7E0L8_9EURY|nr:threonine/serine dehydratase [Halovenus rubra]